jgi:BirA family biotin operon repressor/biotin-[acetyl-CoA-carboxylase] ligase
LKSEFDGNPDFNALRKSKVGAIVNQFFPGTAVRLFEECVSTQSAAGNAVKSRADKALLFVASSQSGGFGRFGRKFYSPPGGLWFSFFAPSSLALLDEDCAVRVAEKVRSRLAEAFSLNLRTKEPNDIVTPSGGKLAGVIVTAIYRGAERRGVIIGMGMNVNNGTDFDGVDAVSLRELTGGPVGLEHVLRLCLQSIAALVYDKS